MLISVPVINDTRFGSFLMGVFNMNAMAEAPAELDAAALRAKVFNCIYYYVESQGAADGFGGSECRRCKQLFNNLPAATIAQLDAVLKQIDELIRVRCTTSLPGKRELLEAIASGSALAILC